MKAILPLKSLIGGVLVTASSVVCAIAYMLAESSADTQPPVIADNENAM